MRNLFYFYLSLVALSKPDLQKEMSTSFFCMPTVENADIPEEKFDFFSSMVILSDQNVTSAFSPLCYDINLYSQLYFCEFGRTYMITAQERLNRIAKSLQKTTDECLGTLNTVYVPINDNKADVVDLDLINKQFYDHNEPTMALKKHLEWLKNESKIKISTPLAERDFFSSARIYLTVITFDGLWKNPFLNEDTKFDSFTLQNKKIVSRKFMNTENYINYNEVKTVNSIFKIVAIPYKQTNKNNSPRYMVYLIPNDPTTELKVLWEEFYSWCEEGIYNTILKMKHVLIDLSIPKINLTSKFDLLDIIPKLYDNAPNVFLKSRMLTKLEITEKGTKAVAIGMTTCIDVPALRSISVKANVPHIAFIYDMDIKRILFILKDTGTDLENK